MSREEANKLSSQRREELRKNRELESNRTLRIKNMLKVIRKFNFTYIVYICLFVCLSICDDSFLTFYVLVVWLYY